MRKLFLALALLLVSVSTVSAQEKQQLFSPIKFNGYFIGYYRYNGQKENVSNGFDFRLLRVIASGRILEDFEWRFQAQVTGNTETLGKSPRMIDMSLEWQRFPEFRVKLGQYKIPFTFENPEHPIDIGFMDNAQVICKLSQYTDRTGIHSSNGRDVGLQIQGDLFPNADGHRLLHYQIGVFNGQGINTPDVGNQKDIIGGASEHSDGSVLTHARVVPYLQKWIADVMLYQQNTIMTIGFSAQSISTQPEASSIP